jgi:hypothetical protein
MSIVTNKLTRKCDRFHCPQTRSHIKGDLWEGRLVMMGWDWRLRTAASRAYCSSSGDSDVDHGMMVSIGANF